jgi:hypothetical protein
VPRELPWPPQPIGLVVLPGQSWPNAHWPDADFRRVLVDDELLCVIDGPTYASNHHLRDL